MAINDLGMVRPGTALQIPFPTYDSNDPSKSVTVTELDVGAITVFKDGSLTQRTSTSGEAVDIDVDGIVGTHWITIDLADNDAAGFYAAGSRYTVVLQGLVIDGATAMSTAVATFEIGYPNAIINTTVASVTSQTQFILTVGPAEADVLIGCKLLFHDVASAVQLAYAYVTAYAVTTKEVTCTDPVGFTFVATDNVSVFLPDNVHAWAGSTVVAGAIPAFAADAGGGLVVSDAGGLDADAMAASVTAVEVVTDNFAFTVANQVDANTLTIEGADATDTLLAAVNAALDTAIAELSQGAPTATPTLRTGLMLLYMMLRNRTDVNTSGTDELAVYNDAGTKIAKKLLTDDTADYSEAEMISGA